MYKDTITEGYRRRQESLLKTIHDQDEDLEKVCQWLEEYHALLKNMPMNLTQDDSMTLLWIAKRDELQAKVKEFLGIVEEM